MASDWSLPQGWTARVTCDGATVLQYQASLFHGGVLKCRLSLAEVGLDQDAAQAHLSERALEWIAEYVQRTPLPDPVGAIVDFEVLPAPTKSQALPMPKLTGPI